MFKLDLLRGIPYFACVHATHTQVLGDRDVAAAVFVDREAEAGEKTSSRNRGSQSSSR